MADSQSSFFLWLIHNYLNWFALKCLIHNYNFFFQTKISMAHSQIFGKSRKKNSSKNLPRPSIDSDNNKFATQLHSLLI